MIAIAITAAADRELTVNRARTAWLVRLVAILRNLGPYAAIELLLPGGTLLALLLWLYRRHRGDSPGMKTFTKILQAKALMTALSQSNFTDLLALLCPLRPATQ